MASATETIVSSSIALEIFIVEVVMFTVAVLSYLLRFILKRKRCDNLGLDDVLVTLSILFFAAVEGLLWHYKATHNFIANAQDSPHRVEYLSRSGVYMVLYWTIVAASQLSLLWLYRYVCSGFSWAKSLLTFVSILTISGWAAFTVCDSLNLAFMETYSGHITGTPMLAGYYSFETASMILEPLCSFLVLCIQLFRLNHIRDKIVENPWVILVPFSTLIVVVTGILRLYYFRQHDTVSERIWLQVHLGSAILSCSLPVYAKLETMCCTALMSEPAPVELWLQDARNADETVTSTARVSKEYSCLPDPESQSLPSVSRPTTRRPSQSSSWKHPPSRPSMASTTHGLTREIVVEPPDEVTVQRDGAQFLPSQRSSRVERATKRLILEG